jgi:hypothetical protein
VIVGDPPPMHVLHGVRVNHLVPQAAKRHVRPKDIIERNKTLIITGE